MNGSWPLRSHDHLHKSNRAISEKNNVAAQHPDKVAALQQRLDELAKQAEKPLFLGDQFQVITKNMQRQAILPTDEDFAGVEQA